MTLAQDLSWGCSQAGPRAVVEAGRPGPPSLGLSQQQASAQGASQKQECPRPMLTPVILLSHERWASAEGNRGERRKVSVPPGRLGGCVYQMGMFGIHCCSQRGLRVPYLGKIIKFSSARTGNTHLLEWMWAGICRNKTMPSADLAWSFHRKQQPQRKPPVFSRPAGSAGGAHVWLCFRNELATET